MTELTSASLFREILPSFTLLSISGTMFSMSGAPGRACQMSLFFSSSVNGEWSLQMLSMVPSLRPCHKATWSDGSLRGG